MAVPCRRRRAGPSPAGQYSQYPSSFSPFARLARRILVTTALELAAVKTLHLASSEAVNSSPTFPLLFLPVCFRLSPDRLTTNRADMLSFVSLFCDSYVPFLSISSPSQTLSRLAITSNVLAYGLATPDALFASPCCVHFKSFARAIGLSPLALGSLLLRAHQRGLSTHAYRYEGRERRQGCYGPHGQWLRNVKAETRREE